VDIIFARCQPRGSCRLSFRDFLAAVAVVADEGGWMFSGVSQALCAAADALSACSTQLLLPQPEQQLPPVNECSVLIEITKTTDVKKTSAVTSGTTDITPTAHVDLMLMEIAELAGNDQLPVKALPRNVTADGKAANASGIATSSTVLCRAAAAGGPPAKVLEVHDSLPLQGGQLEGPCAELGGWPQSQGHPLGDLPDCAGTHVQQLGLGARCVWAAIPVSHLSHTCLTPVSHLSHTCLTPVSYLSHTCLTPVSHLSHTCLIPVSHLSHTCLIPVSFLSGVSRRLWVTSHLRLVP
jgi:hypothetical protein